jgi:23S rRNA pseudouridine1911/1915/1917 synthase
VSETHENHEDDESDDALFEHFRIKVDAGQDYLRIDKFLFERLPNVTRSKVQHAIEAGFIKVNELGVKPSYKVRPQDTIVVSLPQPPRDTEVLPENIPIDVVFEDEYLMVVNKAAGMVVNPAHQNWTGTLVNALVYHFNQLPNLPGNEGRPGLVHRIDKDTSGLLVIAKTEEVLTNLAKQFFDHSIVRRYYALVWGVPDSAAGTIDVNVGRSPKDRRLTIAFPDGLSGKRAVTHYKLLEDFRYVSLVECNLETGRTHQIRAHMKHIGHPLFGDITYGGQEIHKGTSFSKYKQFIKNCFSIMNRQALHAKTLGFIHPKTKENLLFDSELPQDFRDVIEKWKDYVKYLE